MEIWKAIKGFEGLYEVSNFGNVRSLDRTITNKRGNPQYYPGKELKTDASKFSSSYYHRVTLSKDHKSFRFSVHRLVASAFIPNPENKPDINHIDNNASNNKVDNLEWCTHSENMIHAQKQGRLFDSQSKGGTKAGKLARSKRANTVKSMLGSQVNAWTIIGPELIAKGTKNHLLCRCICGVTRTVEYGRLVRKEATSCSAECTKEYKI